MKIYTKTGDAGTTGLLGGARVSKAHDRVAAYGEIDELNSVLGVVRAHPIDARIEGWLERIQSELFDLGSELASTPGKDVALAVHIGEEEILSLEEAIDALEVDLSPLRNFVLPGGTQAAAFLHLARTVCRRAERVIVALAAHEPVRAEALRYVNRLSDLLFVMARACNHLAQLPDVPWVGRQRT